MFAVTFVEPDVEGAESETVLLAMVSDKPKKDQPSSCDAYGESIHLFDLGAALGTVVRIAGGEDFESEEIVEAW